MQDLIRQYNKVLYQVNKAKKGQRFKSYSFETKLQAVRMRIEGKLKREVAAELGIVDKDQIKVWMRRYREHGESALIDKRGKQSLLIIKTTSLKVAFKVICIISFPINLPEIETCEN
ncbi:helix-turn-helix domain-containing protein [Ectobacillus panaciterrae]|uniref:helix-turn-helix domain-containing protein n=1 Tax=Ectobacillus panaciterrae TaxID=363872 RepID=UPI002480A499|nr:helix-turn-helix domain-containing protein [Ectobacillus panaciterrae]